MRKYATSIIIPVFEQWGLVPDLVEAIAQQSMPPGEVLFVDNGSAHVTVPDNIPFKHRVLSCATPGSYAARNHGVQNASGEILVFTDADCVPEPGWLAALLAALGEADDRIVAGHVAVAARSSQPNAYEIYDMMFGIAQKRYVARGYAATANLAASRQLFDALGGFDARRKSGGDADFCRRARAMGASLIFAPDAVVRHPARSTWHELQMKTRRMKGGQLRHQKTVLGLAEAVLKTIARPALDVVRVVSADGWSLSYRAISLAVGVRLWGVELHEMCRLLLGSPEERR